MPFSAPELAAVPAAWPFIHPGMAAAGVALLVLPILIHLLNRRRFRRVEWAAMAFLLAANRRDARRLRIEQLVLLAVRCAILLLMGLAVARPLLRASPLATALGRTSVHRVILLDNSYSMAMPSGDGRTAFDHARALASSLVASFNPADGVSLLTLAAPARAVLERPCYDPQVVGRELAGIERTQRGTDLLGGLTRAASILEASEAPHGNRAVYLITDNTRSTWAQSTGGRAGSTTGAPAAARRLARLAELKILTVGAEQRGNVALTDVAASTRLIGTEQPASFVAHISNHSRDRAAGLSLQIRSDQRVVRTIKLPAIDPAGSQAVPFTLRFAMPGPHRLETVLSGAASDALPFDNTRYVAVAAHRAVRVLLVDGKPGTTYFEGQTGYLATALAPKVEPTDPALLVPRTIADVDLAGEPFDGYAVIALCNLRRVDSATWQRIGTFVEEGGGLLIFLGDQISADHYNRTAFNGGAGLLPARIGDVVGASGGNQVYRFAPEDYSHPVLADFAGETHGGLLLASIHQYVRVEVDRGQPGVRTILRYDSGDPAVVEKAVGEGRVVLVTIPANMEWSNLPARGGYVPLMQNIVHYIAPRTDAHRNVLVGTTAAEPLTARQSSLSLSVTTPAAGRSVRAQLHAVGEGFEAVLPDTEQAGFYDLQLGREHALFAVNLDAAECDLTAMDEDALRDALDCAFTLMVRPETVRRDDVSTASHDIGPRLLYAVLALVLLESWLAMWFGRQR